MRSGDGEPAPEALPPGQLGGWPRGGLVEVLSRWEDSGGQWRILAETERWLTVGLFSCDGGEEMTRVTGERTPVVAAYLIGRVASS
jgi:hypothetical protein